MMSIEVFFIAVIILLLFAVFDLSVGVANDAVNFLNSSIGSRVAPYFVIMIVASLGILAGVTFSGAIGSLQRTRITHFDDGLHCF
jgi:phosphate/sulfate permease